eukprot:TRINITY_DN11714_c0_g1_i2.p1 TRINITY_DN11714_c0_g1~~TRINITY_DN11714_c0_g1_i2.p1  ORF type:complete len:556 (+),score=100.61 TRINITY_DN11714_c0_g1_i2:107-1774(+)
MGRKKIRIEKITDDRNRQVTFTKRKNGLFKKAMELSLLCDCDVTVIIFPKSDRLHQYSSTDIDLILKRVAETSKPMETRTNHDYALLCKKLGADSGDDMGEEASTTRDAYYDHLGSGYESIKSEQQTPAVNEPPSTQAIPHATTHPSITPLVDRQPMDPKIVSSLGLRNDPLVYNLTPKTEKRYEEMNKSFEEIMKANAITYDTSRDQRQSAPQIGPQQMMPPMQQPNPQNHAHIGTPFESINPHAKEPSLHQFRPQYPYQYHMGQYPQMSESQSPRNGMATPAFQLESPILPNFPPINQLGPAGQQSFPSPVNEMAGMNSLSSHAHSQMNPGVHGINTSAMRLPLNPGQQSAGSAMVFKPFPLIHPSVAAPDSKHVLPAPSALVESPLSTGSNTRTSLKARRSFGKGDLSLPTMHTQGTGVAGARTDPKENDPKQSTEPDRQNAEDESPFSPPNPVDKSNSVQISRQADLTSTTAPSDDKRTNSLLNQAVENQNAMFSPNMLAPLKWSTPQTQPDPQQTVPGPSPFIHPADGKAEDAQDSKWKKARTMPSGQES